MRYNDDSCSLSLDQGAGFGRRLSSIGDLDGDGIDELAVCAPFHLDVDAANSGALYIFFFDQNGAIKSSMTISEVSGGFTGKLTAIFALDVAGLGDVDGNGVPDIAVSEQSADNARGTVWILFLEKSKTGIFSVKTSSKIHPDNGGGFTESSSYVGTNFGNSIAGIGDLDQDGVPDLAVGVGRHALEAGSVWILFLNTNGTVKKHQEISNAKGNLGYTLLEDDFFGVSITSLGDLNSDGFTDIAVGVHQDHSGGVNKGTAYILFLNKYGSVKKSLKISEMSSGLMAGIADKTFLGLGLDGESDHNGDGINDLVMGGGGDGNFFVSVVCFLDTGGRVTGYKKFDHQSKPYSGNFKASSRLFTAIASMGDMNNDGIPEMAVGAFTEVDNGAFCLLMSEGTSTTISQIKKDISTQTWSWHREGGEFFLDGPEARYEMYSLTGQLLDSGSKNEGSLALNVDQLVGIKPLVVVVNNGKEREVYRFLNYHL